MPENQQVFRERQVGQPETEQKQPLVEYESKPLSSEDKLLSDENPIESLEIWEGERKKKYVNEYFNTHNIAHEFVWKMPTSEIDKFVRSELESREYEKTTKNYKKILSEIETEIGSENLELSKRLHKIVGYIRAMQKLYKARALREKYLSPKIPSQIL